MSWLENMEREYSYVCEDGHEHLITATKQPDRSLIRTCPSCGKDAKYLALVPIQLGGGTAIEGEQNGRKFIEYKDGRGNVSRISKTKLEYLKNGKTSSVLSNSYKRHLERAQVSSVRGPALKE